MQINKSQVAEQINELIAIRKRQQELMQEIKCTVQHDDYKDLNSAKLRLMNSILSLTVTIGYLKKTIVPKNLESTKVAPKGLGLSTSMNQIIQEYHNV